MSNVKAFGAAGDGSVDETAAIQHAIDDGDGTIVFPRGVYRITRPIEIPLDKVGPIAVDGSGGTARIVMAGAGPALRFVGTHDSSADPRNFESAVWERQRMPTVRGLEIVGNHDEADGIELTGTMQSTLEGLALRRLRHGIHIHGRVRNVIVTHCHVYHNRGVGIFIEDANLHQINIATNHISYNRLGGIRIERSEVRNLQITGNDIEYNNFRSHGTEPTPTAEILIDTTAPGATVNEVTIASNTIQATVSPGGANLRIVDDPDKQDRPPGLWAIAGNVIGSQEVNVHLVGCHGVTLTSNTIYSCDQRNVLVERCDQISFSGNVLRRHNPEFHTGIRFVRSKNCIIASTIIQDETQEGQSSGASLLELAGCRRITISGCQLLDGVPFGLDVDTSSQINVTGCTILDTRDKLAAEAAVRFHGQGDGNSIVACTLGQLELAKESGVHVGENVFVER